MSVYKRIIVVRKPMKAIGKIIFEMKVRKIRTMQLSAKELNFKSLRLNYCKNWRLKTCYKEIDYLQSQNEKIQTRIKINMYK